MAELEVRDLMTTDPVTLNEDEDLDLVSQLMQLTRVRHLPVLRNGEVVGLVSNRDLLAAQASRLGEPADPAQQRAMNRWVKAGWIMTREVQVVSPHTPLREAADLMLTRKYGCLPVVSEGRLVGMLTEADFVRYTLQALEDPGR